MHFVPRFSFLSHVIFVLLAIAANASVSETAFAATSVSSNGAIGSANDWSWSGKSELIFDNIIKESPFFARTKVEAKMVNEIKKRQLSIVSEADILEVIKETTPRLFLGLSIKIFKAAIAAE